MVTSKVNSAIKTTTHRTTENIPNVKDMFGILNNDQTSQNINYVNLSNSQEHQVNYKRPSPESTFPSSPLSSKPPPFNMETHEIPLAKINSNKDKTSKKKTVSYLDLLPPHKVLLIN